MSQTTTQGAAMPWLTDPDAYRKKLDGFLGGRNPMTVLAETAGVLADIVARHSAKLLRSRPFPGKWTPNEVIGHLADTEWVYGYRVRLILCEKEPTILGMDQELWVAGQRLNEREPGELVELFRVLRDSNLTLWRQMTPADFKRVGIHNERGRESLELILRMTAGHDLSHIDQINRYITAAEKPS